MNMLYGYTNFSETNLDYIIKLVRENAGLHLEISGNQLLLKTLDNTVISSVTIHYAEEAGHANTATSAINANYANSANTATTATTATSAGHALTADSATTAGTATTATSATTAGTATEATHATTADTALNANNATHATNADYATTTGNVEHADKAIEAVSINGNNIKFTTYDNTSTEITVPFSTKASRDSSANYITQTYVANVVDNEGVLEFKNAQGNTIVSITPSSQSATVDSYGNTIADFIKTIKASSDSNYVTVTHGTGSAETLTINFANTAWKDTNGNVIKNFYIGSLEIVKDEVTDHYNLVAYNGDTPKAELFRFEINAYKAQLADEATHASSADTAGTAQIAITTPNGDTIESYTKGISGSSTVRQYLEAKDGNGNVISTIDLFSRSRIVIGFKDIDTSNPTDPYTMSVGASNTYIVDDLATYGFTSIWDMLNPGIYTGYINTSDVMIQWCPIYYSNGYYMITCYDYQGQAYKTFRLTKGTNDNELLVERFM